MEQSILKSTKKILGIDEANTAFDQEILTGINTAFGDLTHLGLGPPVGFSVEDESPEWDSFVTTTAGDKRYEGVKTYVQLKTRLLFDPPQTSYVLSSMERQLEQLTWRLNDIREGDKWTDPDPEVIDPNE